MKKDNKGFSLIEVMVGIMILAIIVAPFLASFLRATKINAKSRKMLRATTVAENVMEGLSGFTIEDISKQFGGIYNLREIVGDEGQHLDWESDFLILNNSAGDETIIPEELGPNKSVVTEVGGVPVDRGERVFTQKSDNNVYEYLLRNVIEDKQKFDVKVTIDANKYRNKEAKATNPDDYNKYYNIAAGQMFNVAEMNPKTDIVWAEPAAAWNKYIEEFKTKLENSEYYANLDPKLETDKKMLDQKNEILTSITNGTFLSNCTRTFSLNFDDENAGIEVTLCYTKYNCEYVLDSTKKYFPDITNASQRANLKNIFLCYYPNYALEKEVIQINDMTGFDYIAENHKLPESSHHFNLYVIKQEGDALSNINEETYKVDFNLYTALLLFEENADDNFPEAMEIMEDLKREYTEEQLNAYGYPFSIRGNLGHYFEKENPVPGEKQGIIMDASGKPNQVNFQMKDSSTWVDTPGVPISEDILKKMDVVDGIIRYSGMDKSTKNLIYYTTVEVYEAGAFKIKADGSVDSDESKRIAKLDSDQPWVTE